ncbi:MAG: hypothetical protein GX230_02400 [Lentisphaerae bacterium]|jgi:hypothetical protein|nr:hypothetical protein [Lentisphaerota bacterium]
MLALLLYITTLQPGLSLPDSAVVVSAMQQPTISAFACNHSLSNICGWLITHIIPWGTTPWRANLVSALYGSTLLALFFLLGRRLNISPLLAAACTASLAVSHGVWWHSTIAENYTLSALLLTLCAHLLITNPRTPTAPTIFWLTTITALSIFNHLQNGVLLLGTLWALPELWQRRSSLRRPAIAGLTLGIAPYLLLALWEVSSGRAGTQWFAWLFGGGGFTSQMFVWQGWQTITSPLRIWLWNYPGLFGLIAAGGLLYALRTALRRTGNWRLARLLTATFTITFLFFSGYDTWDRFSFLLLAHTAAAIAALAALSQWENHIQTGTGHSKLAPLRPILITALLTTAAWTPLFYVTTVNALLSNTGTNWLTRPYVAIARQYHGRFNMAGMLLDPVRRDQGTIENFIRTTLDSLPQNTTWVDDNTLYYQTRWLQQHETLRSDITMKLLATDLMPGYGEDAHTLAMARQWRDPDTRWFLTSTNGLSHEMVKALKPFNWHITLYPLNNSHGLFEIIK